MKRKSNHCPVAPSSATEEAEDRLFKECKTLGEYWWKCQRPELENALVSLPANKLESFIRSVSRLFERWPDWVFRVAAEVWHVDFPTIPKRTIEESFRFFHFFMLELRLDGSTPQDEIPSPKLGATVMGALFGHAVAHIKDAQARNLAAIAKEVLSPEQLVKFQRRLSLEAFQADFAPRLADYLRAHPCGMLDLNAAMAKARAHTFDKSGARKETTLTPIYSAILKNWPVIEALSGPTALCAYLSPILQDSEKDPEKRLDRVKKVCRRARITFKQPVKGQTHPPGLSLPPGP